MKCPFRKIMKKEISLNEDGKQTEVVITEEFCECDQSKCMAHNNYRGSCYFVVNGVAPTIK